MSKSGANGRRRRLQHHKQLHYCRRQQKEMKTKPPLLLSRLSTTLCIAPCVWVCVRLRCSNKMSSPRISLFNHLNHLEWELRFSIIFTFAAMSRICTYISQSHISLPYWMPHRHGLGLLLGKPTRLSRKKILKIKDFMKDFRWNPDKK